ncbi:hypothetical protein ES703_102359 [subsurface metagenome]
MRTLIFSCFNLKGPFSPSKKTLLEILRPPIKIKESMKSMSKMERGNGEALNQIEVLSIYNAIPNANEPNSKALKALINSSRLTNLQEIS